MISDNSSAAFRLYLLRHARAGWAESGKTDFDRTLDDEGYAEAEIIAEKLADEGYRPDLVISSTAVRCRETAEALPRALGEELDIRYVDSLYQGTVDVYAEIAFAEREQTSVMIVGHNPTIEEFFHRLVGQPVAEAVMPFGFPTGGVAIVDFDVRPGDANSVARLSAFLAPRSR
ncbi:MAG: histidine phosphatase family protein [Shinella sp.]|nr:histidine phosphatase family protein [Shinella sp.]